MDRILLRKEQMNFNNPKKLQSRIDTIINPYRNNISKSFESNKQYWTLCANCTIENCELDQMVSSSFIKSKQFFGIDHDLETIEKNRKLNTEATFIHGDFFAVLASYKPFNPGIVNMDCLNTFETEKGNIKKVFSLLQRHSRLLFNINVLLGNYQVKLRNPLDFMEFIIKDSDMNYFIVNNKWKLSVNTYIYKGLGSVTKMMSVGLIKL